MVILSIINIQCNKKYTMTQYIEMGQIERTMIAAYVQMLPANRRIDS